MGRSIGTGLQLDKLGAKVKIPSTKTPTYQAMSVKESICENYELTFGKDGAGVVLTFDLDDLHNLDEAKPLMPLTHVRSLSLDEQGFHVSFSNQEAESASALQVLFPLQAGMEEIPSLLREEYGQLLVAALGDGEEEGSSEIAFAREMLLS